MNNSNLIQANITAAKHFTLLIKINNLNSNENNSKHYIYETMT